MSRERFQGVEPALDSPLPTQLAPLSRKSLPLLGVLASPSFCLQHPGWLQMAGSRDCVVTDATACSLSC